MNVQYNPFKENRAEQMRDLWQYYVPFPGFLDSAGKPIVIEGGRGSGKTMIFQCNSWREKLAEIRKHGHSFSDLYEKNPFVGIYHRVDTTFVASMNGRELNWDSIFQSYICVCILKELLEFIRSANMEINIDGLKLTAFIKNFSKRLILEDEIDNIYGFLVLLDKYLDHIEDILNGICTVDSKKFRFVMVHRFIYDVCNEINNLLGKKLLYKIFIDEYETLQVDQQKIVNTLIKHSAIPVIYNIGLRPEGMKTHKTVSETEIIEAPHDFEEIFLRIEADEYKNVLKEICNKRITLGKISGKLPEHASEDIESYLGLYSFDYEIGKIEKSIGSSDFKIELKNIIRTRAIEENANENKIDEYISVLCDNAPLLNARLHFALLCTKTIHTPNVSELFEAFTSMSKRYQEWIHNRKMGIMFLLAKESKREKMYFGFDVFSVLSSNVVRYFLELCEQAFRIGLLDAFDWSGKLSPDVQNEAAKYVSDYKVVDISTYEPYGKELRIFTQYLGKLFYKLHTDSESTVGEPEPNHFSTKDLSLTDKIKNVLSSAIMWNVIQEGEPTKRKQSKLSPETIDYYLNKIYSPHFGISYRNQRKIQLSVSCLNGLMGGNEEIAKEAFNEYFKSTYNATSKSDDITNKQSYSLFDLD